MSARDRLTEALPPRNGNAMNGVPSVTVIIPAYNAANTIAITLDSLLDQTYPAWTCIVVDDASVDATREIVEDRARAYPDRLRLLSLKVNGSAGAARNAGLDQASSEIIAFTDADAFAPRDWLAALVRRLTLLPDSCCGCGGMIGNGRPGMIATADHLLTFSEFVRTSPRAVRALPTINAAFRAACIGATRFPPMSVGEDVAFCHALAAKGYTFHYDPAIHVTHYHERTHLGDLFQRERRNGEGFLNSRAWSALPGSVTLKHPWIIWGYPHVSRIGWRALRGGMGLRFLWCLPMILCGSLYRKCVIFRGAARRRSRSAGERRR